MSLAVLPIMAVVMAAGVALVEALVRRNVLAIALVVAGWVVDSLTTFEGVAVGPMQVLASDVIYGALLVAAIARLLRSDDFSLPQRLLIALGLVIAISVVRGVGEHGIGAAVNESRKYIYLIGGGLYFSTMQPDREDRDRVGRVLVWLAGVATLLALARWAGQVVGVTAGPLEAPESVRVLTAADTLLVVVAFLVLVGRRTVDHRLQLLAAAFFALIVVMQHRTLWILTMVTVAVLVIRDRRVTGRLAALLAVATGVGAILAMTVFGAAELSLAEELSSSARRTGTFEWRIEGWRILLAEQRGDVVDVLVGRPFGGGWERRMDGQLVTASPHNFYLETYLRAGAVGTALLLAWFLAVLRELRSTATTSGWLPDGTLLLVVVGYAVYFLTYTPPTEQALLVGIATAAAGAARQRSWAQLPAAVAPRSAREAAVR